jgi:hypothetical protein
MSKATIKNLVDGIVELITNSDDSYIKLEEMGKKSPGRIEINVDRKKGGICTKLIVRDWADGMTNKELEDALTFGGETSGFATGKSVRGFFGRGLKETILALGEGEISTIKNGKISHTKLWHDKNKGPVYDDESLTQITHTNEPDGTEVRIKITNKNIKIPDYDNFKKQISSHYALRDINSSKKREIVLIFEDLKRHGTYKMPISFSYPDGREIIDEVISLRGFGDKFKVTIFESPEKLSSPRNNPYGLAGILIKTNSSILDNQLFKFESEPAAFYFYGEAVSSDMEDRIRRGEEEIVNLNRGGLEWQHEYCKALSEALEDILEPLVLERKELLEKKPAKKINQTTAKVLKKICNLLNEFAKQENEDGSGSVPTKGEFEISRLLIKPVVANVPANSIRSFSIYASTDLIMAQGEEVRISSESQHIRPLSSHLELERHPKFPETIWYKSFKVATGPKEGEIGNIIAEIGDEKAFARVKIAPFKKRAKSTGLIRRRSGFISEILPDEESDPLQRVVYRDGKIIIYVNFPSVSRFIKSGLEGIETTEGKILLTELIGEAFCRQLAINGLESGKYPMIPGREIDSYNTALNELEKKYLIEIQKIFFS